MPDDGEPDFFAVGVDGQHFWRIEWSVVEI